MPGVQKSVRNPGHENAQVVMTVSKPVHDIARCAMACPKFRAYK